jgi:hypothetical protein
MARLPHFNAVRDQVNIRGFSPRVRMLANEMDIRRVVSRLDFLHLDPAGRETTDIGNWQRRQADISVRLDRQANTSAGAANLQVQVNKAALQGARLGGDEGTTIAQVLIPAQVYQTAFSCPQPNVRTHLLSVVRSALIQSVNSKGAQFLIVEE